MIKLAIDGMKDERRLGDFLSYEPMLEDDKVWRTSNGYIVSDSADETEYGDFIGRVEEFFEEN